MTRNWFELSLFAVTGLLATTSLYSFDSSMMVFFWLFSGLSYLAITIKREMSWDGELLVI